MRYLRAFLYLGACYAFLVFAPLDSVGQRVRSPQPNDETDFARLINKKDLGQFEMDEIFM